MSTYTIPNVIARQPGGERIMDVYSHLLAERIVYLGTPIDSGVANARCMSRAMNGVMCS